MVQERYLHLNILENILLSTGAVSTGNIGRVCRGDKEKELGRAPSMANCLSTTVPVNLAASQIAGRHTPTRNSLRHSRMIVMHRTGHREYTIAFYLSFIYFFLIAACADKNTFFSNYISSSYLTHLNSQCFQTSLKSITSNLCYK